MHMKRAHMRIQKKNIKKVAIYSVIILKDRVEEQKEIICLETKIVAEFLVGKYLPQMPSSPACDLASNSCIKRCRWRKRESRFIPFPSPLSFLRKGFVRKGSRGLQTRKKNRRWRWLQQRQQQQQRRRRRQRHSHT